MYVFIGISVSLYFALYNFPSALLKTASLFVNYILCAKDTPYMIYIIVQAPFSHFISKINKITVMCLVKTIVLLNSNRATVFHHNIILLSK